MSIDLNVRDGETVSLDVSGGAARRTEENIEDIVAALLSAGESVTLTYDDANDDLEVAVPEDGLSFYDGTNLTADVDNSSTTTDELSHAIENSIDVSGSRSLNAWETNTTGHVLLVSLVYRVEPSSGQSIVRTVGSVNNASQSETREFVETVVGTSTTFGDGGPLLLVPDGANYKFEDFGDTSDGSIDKWSEAEYKPN